MGAELSREMSEMLLKGLHDQLLEHVPAGTIHDKETCPLCAMGSSGNGGNSGHGNPRGGSVSEPRTYTEEELRAAVDKAVAEATSQLTAKLSELEDTKRKTEVEQAVAAAKAEADQAIAELQSKLDAAVLEAQNEKAARETLEREHREAEERAAEEVARAERRDERLKLVREHANFPEDYLTENAERFAAMSDEDFQKAIDDWKTITAAAGTSTEIPGKTVLTASRKESDTTKGSALSALRELRAQRVDPRQLRAMEV